jgi:hypothetical protein
MISFLKKIFRKINHDELKLMISAAYFQTAQKNYNNFTDLSEAEYKVFSQNGEDGIIDYLLNQLKIFSPKFVEIGVGDYSECNTRYLFETKNINGLVIDINENLKKKLMKRVKLWRNDLKILEKNIKPSNINEILNTYNFDKDLDLFSLDIDGIDYWIIKQLPKNFSKIAIIEYNSNFGSNTKITVPNIENFDRTSYHFSNLCFGASLSAIIEIMEEKNFKFIGTNEFKCNSFFVNKNYIKNLKLVIPDQKNLKRFVQSTFRESRDSDGKLSFLSKESAKELIKDCEVIDLNSKNFDKLKIGDLKN